ncbi:MFS transporter [Starkeya sp. ORNL1]|uniref:MFS transporter n=1 Tax=Starkeya sp. ORNL1 TaxID=2709380 RepID=UPI0014645FC1|nr:MFS transporter [Starkeya sp. ORNL1]QJP15631.1 MFS transporter [Starkeya sp. ORNL1]
MVDEKAVIGKVAWRFIPLLVTAAFLAYLDRVNVSFAALTMNADLGLSAAAYGFGASIFFVTYVLTEVPSNIILARVGARIWLARIMFTWGLISLLMIFVRGEYSFYLLRALLGIAEAGLYPGIVYFMALWFPARYRARIGSFFWLSIPLSTVIGAPISGLFLNLDGLMGLTGWMWLFILESVPTILMSFVLYTVLRNSPAEAEWLTPSEREWLTRRMASEADAVETNHGVLAALGNSVVLALGFVCFGAVIINYGVNFFLPQIVKGFGLSNTAVGFVTALPSIAAVCGILLFGYISDKTGNRRGCVAVAITAVAGCLALSTLFADPVYKMVALVAAGFFMFGYLAPFWAIPHQFLKGAALAAGIAAINSLGNVGGIVGPWLMGYLRDRTGSFEGGLLALAAVGLLAVPLLLILRRPTPAMQVDVSRSSA